METIDKIITGIGVIIVGGALYVSCGKTLGKINSNHDTIDTEKQFNVAIEKTENSVSIVGIRNYTDYQGDTVEIETIDGLRILTSIVNTTLVKEDNYQDVVDYAKLLAEYDNDKIISYDALCGNELDLETYGWNKKFVNINYQFDKAIEMCDDGTVIVYEIEAWKDWEEDDKIQLVTIDGKVILSHYKNIRLVDTSNASERAFYNYLISLCLDEDNIKYYDSIVKKLK